MVSRQCYLIDAHRCQMACIFRLHCTCISLCSTNTVLQGHPNVSCLSTTSYDQQSSAAQDCHLYHTVMLKKCLFWRVHITRLFVLYGKSRCCQSINQSIEYIVWDREPDVTHWTSWLESTVECAWQPKAAEQFCLTENTMSRW